MIGEKVKNKYLYTVVYDGTFNSYSILIFEQ